jgi:3-oxoacyl-[acyl-carrier protein] reductase
MNGKNALVTGGTRGIGRGIVLALAQAGANVVTCYRQESDAADNLVRELKETAGTHHVVKADVGEPAELDRLMDVVKTLPGTLDVFVHSAGTITHVPFADLPMEQWRRVLDTNLTAAYVLTQKALPSLAKGASIIYVGSKAAVVGIPLRAHYTAAKAGLVGLAKSLSKEFGGRGIRVNVVAPGIVDTSDTAQVDPQMRQIISARMDEYRQRTPLGRLGRPDEIGNVVLFLASDLSSFVTGETINVDGGL